MSTKAESGEQRASIADFISSHDGTVFLCHHRTASSFFYIYLLKKTNKDTVTSRIFARYDGCFSVVLIPSHKILIRYLDTSHRVVITVNH
jgi:uncharacterized membrane protein